MRYSDQVATTYWQRVRYLTLSLLVIWFLVSFGLIFFARELSGLIVFGWPLPFYMAAQGSMLVYLVIIGVYALAMKKIDAATRASLAEGQHEA
ncbi:MAG: DUF4212 domain-containing protein [Burkholderiaceae bacterium]|jgi:putative solute:sodium symporter small subunit